MTLLYSYFYLQSYIHYCTSPPYASYYPLFSICSQNRTHRPISDTVNSVSQTIPKKSHFLPHNIRDECLNRWIGTFWDECILRTTNVCVFFPTIFWCFCLYSPWKYIDVSSLQSLKGARTMTTWS